MNDELNDVKGCFNNLVYEYNNAIKHMKRTCEKWDEKQILADERRAGLQAWRFEYITQQELDEIYDESRVKSQMIDKKYEKENK